MHWVRLYKLDVL